LCDSHVTFVEGCVNWFAVVPLQVQPDGPYLIGGHSYGGTVAMEIAAVLESWGHDVGLVLVSTHVMCS